MRSLYITIKRQEGKGFTTHNFREVPSRLHIESNETVVSISESTFRVSEMVSDETLQKMHSFKRSLEGVKTRR